MTTAERIIDLLPYHFQGGVNNQKIMKGLATLIDEVSEIMGQVEQIGDINSSGVILDKTGEIVNEYRKGETNESFRQRIATKIISNISGGDIETINGLGRVLLGENYVGIIEKYSMSINTEPAALTLIYDFSNVNQPPIVPLKTVIAGGVSLDTAIQFYAPIMDMYDPEVTNLAQFPFLLQP